MKKPLTRLVQVVLILAPLSYFFPKLMLFYFACGLYDVAMLDALHPERRVVGARVIGVREIDDILDAKVRDCTAAAQDLGVRPGMTGREALQLML